MTLFSREHPSQCTAAGFPTEFRVLLTLQGTLKSVKIIIDYERFLLLRGKNLFNKSTLFSWK